MSAKFIQNVYPQCFTDLIVSARFCQVVLVMHVLARDSFILRLFHSEYNFMAFHGPVCCGVNGRSSLLHSYKHILNILKISKNEN